MLHRGNITITGLEDINRHPTVSVKLENGNVWLTKHELARLFGVFIQTIDANMRSIFKSRILNESEATITEKQDKRYVTYYNLEAVIFLSFRINTYCTKLFREWVLNSLCEYKRLKELSNRKYGYKQIADRKVDNGAEKTSAVRHPRTDGA